MLKAIRCQTIKEYLKIPGKKVSLTRASLMMGLWRRSFEAVVYRSMGVVLLFVLHAYVANMIGSDGYGRFSFILSVSGIVAMIATLGWPSAITRFVASYNEMHEWALLHGVIRKSHQMIIILSVSVALMMEVGAFSILDSENLRLSLFLSGFLVPLVAILNLRRMIFQGFQEIRKSIVPEDILLPAIFLFLVIELGSHGVVDVVFLYICSMIFVVTAQTYLLKKKLETIPYKEACKYKTYSWMKVAFPMVAAGLSQVVLNRSDILILGSFVDMRDVGIYSAASRLALFLVFILTAINVVISPLLAASYHSGRLNEFRRYILQGMLWSGAGAFPIFVFMFMYSNELMGLFGEEFKEGGGILRLLSVGQLINALTGPVGYAAIMSKGERYYGYLVVLISVMNVILNLVVVKALGVVGVALVTTSCVIALNLALLFYVLKITRGYKKNAA